MIPFHFHSTPPVHGERTITVPTNLESKKDLFAFLFRAVPLPDYFGHNWDALDECLSDLEWLGEEKITLVHADVPLGKNARDRKTYLQVLAEAARDSKRLRVEFPEQDRALIDSLLAKTD